VAARLTNAVDLADHPARALAVEWAQHLRRDRRRSEHTIRAYLATAHRLIAFLGNHRAAAIDVAAICRIDTAELRAYFAARREEGLGSTAAARELSALRGFLTFAGAELPHVKGPRVKRGVPRPISPADAIALAEDAADAATKPWMAARDLAVLLLLYGAGLRVGEAMGLTGGVLPIGKAIAVTGKRGKTRIVPIIPPVADAIADYVRRCPWPMTRELPLPRAPRAGRDPLTAGRPARRETRAVRASSARGSAGHNPRSRPQPAE